MMEKSKKPSAARAAKKKNHGLLFVMAAVVIVCAAVVLFARDGFGASGNEIDDVGTNAKAAVVVGAGEALAISASDITEDASFYSVEVDGTRMEVIAVRDSQGEIRTAFNTCRVCYGSSRAYYVQEGDYLVCQNCGNRFSMDRVGLESGGCNPWPITENDRMIAGDDVSIPYETLAAAEKIFANWKTDY